MTRSSQVGLLQVQGLRNNLAKWLLYPRFLLGKVREVTLTLLQALTGHQGSWEHSVFNSFLPSSHRSSDPAGRRSRRVTVLLSTTVSWSSLDRWASLSWESGLGLPYSCTRSWAALVSQLLARASLLAAQQAFPNTRTCGGQGASPSPWSWETEHVSVLSLWIHFTDQEHITLLSNIR